MHTPDSVLQLITGLYVFAIGGSLLYYIRSMHHALPDQLLRSRVAWTALLLLFVMLGAVLNFPEAVHILTPERQTTVRPFRFFVSNALIAFAYAAGDHTLRVARKYDFPGERRSLPVRLVWRLSPMLWPRVLFIWLLVPALAMLVDHPILRALSFGVLPAIGSLVLWPVIVAGLLSTRRWIADSRLKQNMKWHAYLILSIAAILWGNVILVGSLGVRGAGVSLFASALFPLIIYTGYRSARSLITTHKISALPPLGSA